LHGRGDKASELVLLNVLLIQVLIHVLDLLLSGLVTDDLIKSTNDFFKPLIFRFLLEQLVFKARDCWQAATVEVFQIVINCKATKVTPDLDSFLLRQLLVEVNTELIDEPVVIIRPFLLNKLCLLHRLHTANDLLIAFCNISGEGISLAIEDALI